MVKTKLLFSLDFWKFLLYTTGKYDEFNDSAEWIEVLQVEISNFV